MTDEERKAFASSIGSIITEKKSASSRKNLELARAARAKSLNPCNCGRADKHRSTCPVYQRIAQQKVRAKRVGTE